MKSKFKIKIQSVNNMLIVYSLMITTITPALFAETNDDIINKLYKEIINSSSIHTVTSSPSSKADPDLSTKNDSITSNETEPNDLPVQPSEQLKREIEKIQNDIELRHSATVKFMQE